MTRIILFALILLLASCAEKQETQPLIFCGSGVLMCWPV
jgi:hypothetical protein